MFKEWSEVLSRGDKIAFEIVYLITQIVQSCLVTTFDPHEGSRVNAFVYMTPSPYCHI